MKAWDRVLKARRIDRPTAQKYIEHLCPDFIELHGDRQFMDDAAIIGGIGTLDGIPVTIIGQEKGSKTKEKVKRNFGMSNPEGYRKSLRLMKQAEKFNRPIITIVDTTGAFCGIEAEERGQGEAIARNLFEMSDLKVPIISIIIGEGGSGGALALAVSDEVWMFENAIYSILSPEGFASILYKDGSLAPEAAEHMKITADELLKLNIIESIIEEPFEGAHESFDILIGPLKDQLVKKLTELCSLSKEEMLQKRYQRYRKY
jgi:acetyl-CoA carboxylase carboxyl transferase alpha subunit